MQKNRLKVWHQPAQPLPTVAVAWYTESEWARVKATATDPERFEASFKEWQAMAEDAVADIRKAGVVLEKYFIKADQLLAWCMLHNLENNSDARTEFVCARGGGPQTEV